MTGSPVQARLAHDLATALTERGFPASVRALLPWPSTTPHTGEVLLVEVAGKPRPVALVDWWKVVAHGPTWDGRSPWRWQDQGQIPRGDIVAGLVDLVRRWSHRPETVGLLDVVEALREALPPVEGAWRMQVNEEDAWIGVERGRLRWSAAAHVHSRRGLELVHDAAPPGTTRRWEVLTQDDVRRAVAEAVPLVAAWMAWCERYVVEHQALERFAGQLCLELAERHPPPHGVWSVWMPSALLFGVRDVPSAHLGWGEAGHGTQISVRADAGRLVIDGVTYSDDTPLAVVADAIAERARKTLELRKGHLYRMKRSHAGFHEGDIVRYLRTEATRDEVTFHAFEGADPKLRRGTEHVEGRRRYWGFTLFEDRPDDARVMNALGDWLEHLGP